MSGMGDFLLPNTTTILWCQRQMVPASFPLDHMKPPSPFGSPHGGLLRLKFLAWVISYSLTIYL